MARRLNKTTGKYVRSADDVGSTRSQSVFQFVGGRPTQLQRSTLKRLCREANREYHQPKTYEAAEHMIKTLENEKHSKAITFTPVVTRTHYVENAPKKEHRKSSGVAPEQWHELTRLRKLSGIEFQHPHTYGQAVREIEKYPIAVRTVDAINTCRIVIDNGTPYYQMSALRHVREILAMAAQTSIDTAPLQVAVDELESVVATGDTATAVVGARDS